MTLEEQNAELKKQVEALTAAVGKLTSKPEPERVIWDGTRSIEADLAKVASGEILIEQPAHSRLGRPMVSSTASAPSLPRDSLCRQSSAIRTGCANERPSGSEEGVASNRDPYSDLKSRVRFRHFIACSATVGNDRRGAV
jgi:hypothetical protein